jgi:hypothetical protein
MTTLKTLEQFTATTEAQNFASQIVERFDGLMQFTTENKAAPAPVFAAA